MKRAKQWITVSILALVGLSACQLSLQSALDHAASSGGSLQLTVGDGSALRASQLGSTVEPIVPDAEDLEIVAYTLTAVGPDDETESDQTTDTENPSFSLGPLVPGEWDITVEGLRAGDEVLVRATTTVDITAGETTNANLSPTPISGEGQLSLTVEWPSEAELDAVTVEGVQSAVLENINTEEEQPLSFEAAAGPTAEFSGPIDSGYYVLTVDLENDGAQLLATRRTSVHVYAGVMTAGTVEFSVSSLESPPGSPQSVAATQAGDDDAAIAVSWIGPTDGPAPVGYLLERKEAEEGDAAYERVAALEAPVDEFTDEEVAAGSWYEYRIIAFNKSGESEPVESPATGLFAISGAVTDDDDQSGIENASVTGIFGGEDLFEATADTDGTYETVFTVEDQSAGDLPGSLTVRAAAADYGSDELIVEFGDAMVADFSLIAADEGGVPAPLLSLLFEIDAGDGSLRPNFDLQLEVVMPDGLSGDETLYVSVHVQGGAPDFAEHNPEDPVTYVPDTIPFTETIVVEAYIEDDGVESETTTETYLVDYDTLSVSPDGNDDYPGTNTEPLRSLGEAIARVGDAGGAGEISRIRMEAGNYEFNADEGGLLSGVVGLLATAEGSETAVRIDAISNLSISGAYGEYFYEVDATGETVLDAANAADHVITVQNGASNLVFERLTITGGGRGQNNTYGGGLLVLDSTDVALENNVVIVGNEAERGGGVAVIENEGTAQRFTMDSTVIVSSNNADYGGGLYIAGGSDHQISGIVDLNTAIEGGGIFGSGGNSHTFDGNVTNNGTLNGQGPDGPDTEYGGGLRLLDGEQHEVFGLFEGNRAQDGGGVFASEGIGHEFSAVIQNNRASLYGAGLSLEFTEGSRIGGEIRGNRDIDDLDGILEGGGISIFRDTDYTILAGLQVEDNVTGLNGAGIYIYEATYDQLSTDSVVIAGNEAWEGASGGGIYNVLGTSVEDYEIPDAVLIAWGLDNESPVNDPDDYVQEEDDGPGGGPPGG